MVVASFPIASACDHSQFTSTMSAMIAGSNSQARLIFNAAREGLLPSSLAKLHSQRHTPWASFLVFFGIGLAIVYIFGWTVEPVTFFGEIATLGTILVAVTYLVSNIALPVYYRRHHPDQFSWLKHLILPILGVLAIGFPLWALVQPGQPAPFNLFPWIALGIIVIGLIYAVIISRRDPTLGDRVGSIVADLVETEENLAREYDPHPLLPHRRDHVSVGTASDDGH